MRWEALLPVLLAGVVAQKTPENATIFYRGAKWDDQHPAELCLIVDYQDIEASMVECLELLAESKKDKPDALFVRVENVAVPAIPIFNVSDPVLLSPADGKTEPAQQIGNSSPQKKVIEYLLPLSLQDPSTNRKSPPVPLEPSSTSLGGLSTSTEPPAGGAGTPIGLEEAPVGAESPRVGGEAVTFVGSSMGDLKIETQSLQSCVLEVFAAKVYEGSKALVAENRSVRKNEMIPSTYSDLRFRLSQCGADDLPEVVSASFIVLFEYKVGHFEATPRVPNSDLLGTLYKKEKKLAKAGIVSNALKKAMKNVGNAKDALVGFEYELEYKSVRFMPHGKTFKNEFNATDILTPPAHDETHAAYLGASLINWTQTWPTFRQVSPPPDSGAPPSSECVPVFLDKPTGATYYKQLSVDGKPTFPAVVLGPAFKSLHLKFENCPQATRVNRPPLFDLTVAYHYGLRPSEKSTLASTPINSNLPLPIDGTASKNENENDNQNQNQNDDDKENENDSKNEKKNEEEEKSDETTNSKQPLCPNVDGSAGAAALVPSVKLEYMFGTDQKTLQECSHSGDIQNDITSGLERCLKAALDQNRQPLSFLYTRSHRCLELHSTDDLAVFQLPDILDPPRFNATASTFAGVSVSIQLPELLLDSCNSTAYMELQDSTKHPLLSKAGDVSKIDPSSLEGRKGAFLKLGRKNTNAEADFVPEPCYASSPANLSLHAAVGFEFTPIGPSDGVLQAIPALTPPPSGSKPDKGSKSSEEGKLKRGDTKESSKSEASAGMSIGLISLVTLLVPVSLFVSTM